MVDVKPSVRLFFSLNVLACERSKGRRRQTEPPRLNTSRSPSPHLVNFKNETRKWETREFSQKHPRTVTDLIWILSSLGLSELRFSWSALIVNIKLSTVFSN